MAPISRALGNATRVPGDAKLSVMCAEALGEPLDLAGKSFTLKPLVVARLFAEITACLIVVALPVVAALPVHKYHIAPTTMAALILLAVAAACLLPSYGFITYKVAVDDEQGLKLLSAFKKQLVEWTEITSLGLKTSFGWRRYVISTTGESATFPIWLGNVQDLVATIRSRLPERGMSEAARQRVFQQHPVGLVMQVAKLGVTVIFIALFWYFFATLIKSARHEPLDVAIILGACLVLTALMLWRIWLIASMPRRVEVQNDGLHLSTWFVERKPVLWAETRKVNAPPLLLPDGTLLKTPVGWFLLSADLESFDELQFEVDRHLAVYEEPALKQFQPKASEQKSPVQELPRHGNRKPGGSKGADTAPEGPAGSTPDKGGTDQSKPKRGKRKKPKS